MPLIESLRVCLHRHHDGDVVIALSGGMDSTALLHATHSALTNTARAVRAIHVNHGLHPAADTWQVHCEQICSALGIALVCERVRVELHGEGLEAAARKARYSAFAKHLSAGDNLLLAHHLDDQVETFLQRLGRGSTLEGLSGMLPARREKHFQMLRPWLAIARDHIRSYAVKHALPWLDDPSNESTQFTRNALRHNVIPIWRKRVPALQQNLFNVVTQLRHTNDFISHCAAAALPSLLHTTPYPFGELAGLSLHDFLLQPVALQLPIVKIWLRNSRLDEPTTSLLDWIRGDALTASDDATPAFQWDHSVVHRYRGMLYAQRPQEMIPIDWQMNWSAMAPVDLPMQLGTLALDPPAHTAKNWRLQGRRGGEKIQLPGHSNRTELKTWLQENGVPPWLRQRLVLVWEKDRLIAVAGLLQSSELADGIAHLRYSQPVLRTP
jgi:tRNA(Ile)-lysidine synthase